MDIAPKDASSSSRDEEASRAFPSPRTYGEAVAAFKTSASRWVSLPFFVNGGAESVAVKLDARARAGAEVLPPPDLVFAALEMTPLERTRVVILGQDPYPTPGDAHGLAFSVRRTDKLPPSLTNIFRELKADLGLPRPTSGDLGRWAKQGVLLLNPCLTVEAGNAGCHRRIGWQRLADEVMASVSATSEACVFVLWGNEARARKPRIDTARHLIIESPHPSPLSARGGFFGSRPFSRANAWLRMKGRAEIDWRLGDP